MFDLIDGLPVHPLVVHGVVVLLPLAILGTVLIAFRASWRRRYGVLVLAVAVVATALVPVATSSGESLERRVGDPGEHAELGDQLLWFAVPLVVVLAALVLLQRRADRAGAAAPDGTGTRRGARSPALLVVAVVAVVIAVANGYQVYRVGDTGARAAWGDQVAVSSR